MRGIVRATIAVSLVGLATPAWAQDDFEDAFEAPEATPAPAPAPAAPAAAGGGATDHDQTIGDWGVQVAGIDAEPAGGGAIPYLGVRKWTGRDSGWEAGVALRFVSDAGSDASLVVLGGTFGLLQALGVFDHMTVFWEPQGTLLVSLPNDGIDGTDDDPAFIIDGRVNVGAEVRLGMVGLPRLGLTARLGAGVRIVQAGGETGIDLGTFGAQAASIDGLLESTVGFVMYF